MENSDLSISFSHPPQLNVLELDKTLKAAGALLDNDILFCYSGDSGRSAGAWRVANLSRKRRSLRRY